MEHGTISLQHNQSLLHYATTILGYQLSLARNHRSLSHSSRLQVYFLVSNTQNTKYLHAYLLPNRDEASQLSGRISFLVKFDKGKI